MACHNGAHKGATGMLSSPLDESNGNNNNSNNNNNNNNINNNAKVERQRDPKKVVPYWLHGMVFYIPAEDFEYHLTKLITYGAVSEWYAKDKPRGMKHEQDSFDVSQDDIGSVQTSPEPTARKASLDAENPDAIISKRNLVRSLTEPSGLVVPRAHGPAVEMPAQPWRQTRLAWEQGQSLSDSLTSDGEEQQQ